MDDNLSQFDLQTISLSDMFIINLTKCFNFLGDLNSGVNQEFESFNGIHYNQHLIKFKGVHTEVQHLTAEKT